MDNIRDEQKKELKQWKNRIHQYRHDAAVQFNKQVVYLSSGGLILTLGFIKDIVDIKIATFNVLLVISWFLFSLALVTNLFSHKSTIKAMDYELDDKTKDSDDQDVKTIFLDNISVVSLIIAILLFITYVYINSF